MPPTRANGGRDEKVSADGKAIYCGAVLCSIVGLTLLIVGAVVYYSNVDDIVQSCTCPEGESGGACCMNMDSLCDECWCTDSEEPEGYCSEYEETVSGGGGGRSIALAGLVVCFTSACMLLSMKACIRWSEINLHEKRPAVATNATV